MCCVGGCSGGGGECIVGDVVLGEHCMGRFCSYIFLYITCVCMYGVCTIITAYIYIPVYIYSDNTTVYTIVYISVYITPITTPSPHYPTQGHYKSTQATLEQRIAQLTTAVQEAVQGQQQAQESLVMATERIAVLEEHAGQVV